MMDIHVHVCPSFYITVYFIQSFRDVLDLEHV